MAGSVWDYKHAQMLMQAIAHGSCADTERESALNFDLGRKIPCRTGDSNPRQYRASLFSGTLYQLSYSRRFAAETDRWHAHLKHTYCVVIDTP